MKGCYGFDVKKFIQLVKQRPPIYTSAHPSHRNRSVVNKLWEEIAKEVKKPVTDCKSMWHQLRNNFKRELRYEKIHHSKKRITWHLKESLEFLRGHIVKTHRHNEKCSSNSSEESRKDENTDELKEVENQHEDLFECDEYQKYEETEPVLEEIESSNQRNIEESVNTQYVQENQQQFKTSLNCSEINTDVTFFKSLLPDIQKLSSKRKRKLKEIILVSLNRLLDEDEDEENGNYNTIQVERQSDSSETYTKIEGN